jgi:hypothetical protein
MILYTLGTIFLLTLIYQDFKFRKISWVLLPLLFTVLVLMAAQHFNWKDASKNFGINASFLLLQFVLLSVYFSIRKKKLTNIFDSMIGWGDILMLLVLCMAFSPMNFIFFYLSSLIFSVVFFLIIRLKNNTVPLAGMQSALLLLVWICNLTIPGIDIYNDTWLATFLNNG